MRKLVITGETLPTILLDGGCLTELSAVTSCTRPVQDSNLQPQTVAEPSKCGYCE